MRVLSVIPSAQIMPRRQELLRQLAAILTENSAGRHHTAPATRHMSRGVQHGLWLTTRHVLAEAAAGVVDCAPQRSRRLQHMHDSTVS